MRTLIIIRKRGAGYIMDVAGMHGGGYQGRQCGVTPYEAAPVATRAMCTFSAPNPDGGDLMAPPEVMELVPENWHNVSALS